MPDSLSPVAPSVPAQPSVDGLEATWLARWEREGTYRFRRDATRDEVYSIDTPPPTVSGLLHIGHVFSYTQADVVARFWRMRGKDVFYPMGWDDNGLPTERRVENVFGVRCDPSLPYDAAFTAPEAPAKETVAISRRNFIELCVGLTVTDEEAFKELWQHLGLSVDWSLEYSTVGERSRAISQRAFLEMLARGEVYSSIAPTLWDVDYRTAVSQAELEDRERPGAYYRIPFDRVDHDGTIEIDTTRPELLASCVALVTHPDDARHAALVDTFVRTPLFGIDVPVLAHPLADPDKGTGVAMVCTFGDTTDVVWWRELGLPTRTLIGRDGRFGPADFRSLDFPSHDPGVADGHYGSLEGRSVTQGRAAMVEALRGSQLLVGDAREITHPVKFYERGERPLEIVTSRQWFVRTLEHREALLARGEALRWHPDFMRHRYRSWVEGLNVDWNISRQRFFGVPFPLWYPLDERGEPDYDAPIAPEAASLPVDPSSESPPGYDEGQRGEPGGFVADPDIFDTWATSSLSPQIAGDWGSDLFARVFPMNLRPQAHEIIRTWLFSTVVRSHFQEDSLPFYDTLISGWVLDPDRKKMSKSKGAAATPMPLLEKHGADALRYWAASARSGVDTTLDESQMKIGRRLAIKLLNVSRFVLGRVPDVRAVEALQVVDPLDRDRLSMLAELVERATSDFEHYDYAQALARTESFFWSFCDDYVETVKTRAYDETNGEGAASARAALVLSLSILLRLFAPFLPYVSEEVWRWWHEGSVHLAPWPVREELGTLERGGELSSVLAEALEAIRRAKSSAKRSQRAAIAHLVIRAPAPARAMLELIARDLVLVGSVRELSIEDGDELAFEVTLADD